VPSHYIWLLQVQVHYNNFVPVPALPLQQTMLRSRDLGKCKNGYLANSLPTWQPYQALQDNGGTAGN